MARRRRGETEYQQTRRKLISELWKRLKLMCLVIEMAILSQKFYQIIRQSFLRIWKIKLSQCMQRE